MARLVAVQECAGECGELDPLVEAARTRRWSDEYLHIWLDAT